MEPNKVDEREAQGNTMIIIQIIHQKRYTSDEEITL
jgi:hypothetical protein